MQGERGVLCTRASETPACAASGAGEVFADESYGDEGPAGEDQVYAHQEADRPVGRAGELGEDEDADQEAGDAAEPDKAGALPAAAGEGDGDPGHAHEEE